MRLEQDTHFTALSWVKPELDETLKQARMALESYVEDGGDRTQLQTCVAQLHQVHGVLRMVEIYGAAMVAEEMEQLATALLGDGVANRDEAYGALMRSIMQVPDYLERLQSGQKDVPMVLMPLVNDLRGARGEAVVSESVLFSVDVNRPLPASAGPVPAQLPAAAVREALSPVSASFLAGLSAWAQDQESPAQVTAMADACTRVVAVCSHHAVRVPFWIAGGLLGAIGANMFAPSKPLKLAVGKLEGVFRRLLDGGEDAFKSQPPLEVARQLLYFTSTAPTTDARVAAIREAFGLPSAPQAERDASQAQGNLGGMNRDVLDTVTGSIKEDLLRVKEALDLHLRASGASPADLAPHADALRVVADTLGMLGLGVPRKIVQDQRSAIQQLASGERAADEAALLEIAGNLLQVEATLDDQVANLGQQGEGGSAETSVVPLRESQEALDALIKESVTNFVQARQCFVAFIEAGWDHVQLNDVPRLLDEVSGAMHLLEQPRAARQLRALSVFTQLELLKLQRVPDAAQMDRLADALASLEYYLEALRDHRPQRDRILDLAEHGLVALGYWPIPASAERALQEAAEAAQAAAAPKPAAVAPPVVAPPVVAAQEAPHSVVVPPAVPQPAVAVAAASAPAPAAGDAHVAPTAAPAPASAPVATAATPASEAAPVAAPVAATPTPAAIPVAPSAPGKNYGFADSAEVDDDIREVFVEELDEEMSNLSDLYDQWCAAPNDLDVLRPLRRVFHTLKGSGRLVGALELGEFSWKYEGMLNRVLDGSRPPSAAVIAHVGLAKDVLPQFRGALLGNAQVTADIEGLKEYADRIAAGEDVAYTPAAASVAVVQPEPVAVVEAQPEPVVQVTPQVEPVVEKVPEPVEVPVPVVEEPVAIVEPGLSGAGDVLPEGAAYATVDPVLLDILRNEVDAHLTTIRQWIAAASAQSQPVSDALLRAVHTISGAFAMTEVPLITDALSPTEGYIRRLLVQQQAPSAAGAALIRDVAAAIETVLGALQQRNPFVTSQQALADRAVALRDELPEPTTPVLPVQVDEVEAAQEAAQAEAARLAAEQAEAERVAAERAEADRLAAEHAAAERLAAEQAEAERLAAERAEAERAAAAQAEADRLAAEQAEAERFAAERAEAERVAAAQAEAERLAAEQAEAEAERVAAERAEAERVAAERAEADRVAAEQAEAERVAAETAEAEHLAAEQAEAERLAAGRAEAERVAAETAEAERLAAEQAEAERAAAAQAEAERVAAEQAEAERAAAERWAAEQADAERRATERHAAEQAELDMLAAAMAAELRGDSGGGVAAESTQTAFEHAQAPGPGSVDSDETITTPEAGPLVASEQPIESESEVQHAGDAESSDETVPSPTEAEAQAADDAPVASIDEPVSEAEQRAAEQAEEERQEYERLEAEYAEQARLAEEQRRAAEQAEAERLEYERLEAESADQAWQAEESRIAAEQAEAERIAAEQAEAERVAAEQAEAERVAAEQAEAERVAAEQAEAERVAAEQAEAERIAAEQAEAERVAAEQAEAERVAAEQAEAERVVAEQAEAERVAAEQAEAERVAAEQAEARRVAAEQAEAERVAAEQAEAERVAAEHVEAERREADRREGERRAADRRTEEAAETDRAATEAVGAQLAHEATTAVPFAFAAGVDPDPDEPLDLTDVDPELMDIFVEETTDILDHSDGLLSRLRESPSEREMVVGLQRDLHTLKGGARMCGMMSVGELAHAMESVLEGAADSRLELDATGLGILEQGFDRLHSMLTRITHRQAVALPEQMIAVFNGLARGVVPVVKPVVQPTAVPEAETPVARATEAEHLEQAAAPTPSEQVPASPAPEPAEAAPAGAKPAFKPFSAPAETAFDQDEEIGVRAPQEQVRIRADLLDRLVNYAGEVAIYRARLEQQLGTFRSHLDEMEQTTDRLRQQLRKLEIETEAQISARYQRAGEVDKEFDPLELDRFSTQQQLTRALSESASDMTSLHASLDEVTRQYETLLLQQSRVSSDLQDGLMRTRMVPFDALVPRLRRVIRQAATETSKLIQLKVEGAQGEMDRNVLDRMTAPLEHMLRNSAVHGLEPPADRVAAGKPEEGTVTVSMRREGSEVVMHVTDDGRGLNRDAIRNKAIERGLLKPDAHVSDHALYAFILESGFSTADTVSRLAGRGVGMDVVHNEIRQLGGSLQLDSVAGKGTTVTIRLPFTLAVTQAAIVKIGETSFAVPIASVQGVGRIARDELEKQLASANPSFAYGGDEFAIHDMGKLLGQAPAKAPNSLQMPLLLSRSGDTRAAICVDEVLGSREIVVKPVGPQVSSIPGIFGATIMGDGGVMMILDVAPLVRRAMALAEAPEEVVVEAAPEVRRTPLVMVVDDSITMRKVTGRVLERNNLEVLAAKDGVDAIEKMVDVIPDVMLLDIEMPRMDGYELATHMRNDPRLREVPIIMITSRSGEKHRQRAFEIGVNRYLGKPYQEAELMRNVFELLTPVHHDG